MLNAKEEKKYQRLRKLGQELHIPIPEAFWELEVFDKDGRLIHAHRQRSHSWVRNAYNLMFGQLAAKDLDDAGLWGAGYISMKDTGGSIRAGDGNGIYNPTNVSTDGTDWGYRGPAGNDDYGILVGSGTDAESFEDYKLQTQIAEGSGAGQLNHAQSGPHNLTYNAGTKVLGNTLVRYFNNNSGGDVDINEVGLFCRAYYVGGGSPAYYGLCRDKLASTVTVPDTGQLKVTYTIQLTYPA